MNVVLYETRLSSGQTIQFVRGDITTETTEAIVNAANRLLQHGAGVAGAIVRNGGFVIQQESDAWVHEHGPVEHGAPAWTSGGRLPCRYVIHAVGPMWGEGQEDEKLDAAVRGSLKVADDLGVASIAIPAISSGIFGFPKERAAAVILKAVGDYFSGGPVSRISQLRLVLYDQPTIAAFQKAWHDYFKA